jgi:hypothetical protein
MTPPVLRSLLTGLIDYAGLFPPAGLPMDAAVRNYDSYVRGEHARSGCERLESERAGRDERCGCRRPV